MVQNKAQRLLVLLAMLAPLVANAQLKSGDQIKKACEAHLATGLEELRDFLRLENDGKIPSQISSNLEFCKKALTRRRFEVKQLALGGVPYLFGQRVTDPKLPWVLVYIQIDGEPALGLDWDQPNPFEPVLKRKEGTTWVKMDWQPPFDPRSRVFARSASDSKGPAQAFLSALDILDHQKTKPTSNIKLILDFQEELGSPTLPELVAANKDLFKASMVLIMDGARHVSNLPTLNFGARGIATLRLTVFGPTTELHSGQYGNFAPNPVFPLARLLSGMKDENGRVLVPGFYDGVSLSTDEQAALDETPNDDSALARRIGIAHPDRVADSYEASLQYPSLNVRGLQAASTGDDVRGVIPSEAVAEIDLRLVPETEGERMISLVKNYVTQNGFHLVNGSPTPQERAAYDKLASLTYRIGSKPFRTDLNSTEGKWLDRAMMRVFGKGNYVRQRTTGGSQPIEPFVTLLGIPAISVRFPNPDNNIHAANENLEVGSFLEGLQMCVGILTEKMN